MNSSATMFARPASAIFPRRKELASLAAEEESRFSRRALRGQARARAFVSCVGGDHMGRLQPSSRVFTLA